MISIKRHPVLMAGVVAVVAAGAFLAVQGTKPKAPFFFVLAAVAILALTIHYLARAGRALVAEPAEEELRVATGRRRKELEREKQSLVKALKELEFDHEMRKISDADYQEIAANYRARAMRTMQQLDAQPASNDEASS